MYERLLELGIESPGTMETLSNYLDGERVPDVPQAWALGEALRDSKVEWANGFSMLWAVGKYEAALSTTFEYVASRRQKLDDDEINMLWYAALTGITLPQIETDLDTEPAVMRHAVKSGDGHMRPVATSTVDVQSADFDADAYERHGHILTVTVRGDYVERWAAVVPYIESLEKAFMTACIRRSEEYKARHEALSDNFWGLKTIADPISEAALDLARSSKLPVASLETCILIVLGQYLNMLDPTINDGAVSMSPYPRPAVP